MLAELVQVESQKIECLVNGVVVAVVEYDWSRDGETQPYQVRIGNKVYHEANTEAKCVSWVNTQLKRGTLPAIETPVETVEQACDDNNVVCHDSKTATDVYIITTQDNEMIGTIGASSTGWWAMPLSAASRIPLYSRSCKELVEKLLLIERALSKS